MTIQVSTAVDVSLEHSSSAAEMVEVPSLRINPLEECEREPLMSSHSGVVEVEQLLELLEEQEDQEESEADAESNNNTAFSDSDNSSNHQHQGKLIRRDSDTSDVSSSDGNDNNQVASKAVSPEVAERIISQVEAMFSDDHLAKDGFLLKHVRRRSDGFVSLKLVAGLRKVKQISRDFPVVMNSLRSSAKLEVNSEGTKIRRIEPLTAMLKSLPTTGQKETKKENTKENIVASKEKEVPTTTTANNKDASDEQQLNRNNNGRNNRNNRQAMRKMSSVSTGSSTGGSRHGSFSSGKPHPAELFRNVMSCTSSSASGEDSPQTPRRRGGSLPIATGNPRPYSYNMSPNSSPPNPGLRPKSNSYCEGQNINGPATTTMSPWLMKRKQSNSRNSEGSIVLSGVIRQPRGPDGTKGFASGYRTLILREKETLLNCQTTVSA
jgi:hypothetical protein